MTDIDVPKDVLMAGINAFNAEIERQLTATKRTGPAIEAALRASLSAWVVTQHQAYWPKEGCWEDITPEQFADLETTEAITRIAYTLRQEKPE